MRRPLKPTPPSLREVESREGVRSAVRAIYDWFYQFIQDLDQFDSDVVNELERLYGELDWTPTLIANGAQTIVTVTVSNTIPGYFVEATYDKDLQGLQMTAHISAADTVKIVLKNDTGAGVTLTAGRFRCYVQARTLSS